MSKIELVPFIPQTAKYRIYHPKDFELIEADNGVVSITSPITFSSLTLSSYHANQKVTEEILLKFFQNCTKNYTALSDIAKDIVADKFLFEGNFKKDSTWWIWWAIANSNQIIIASVHSENELSIDDYNLYKFMLAKMEIYPEEFE